MKNNNRRMVISLCWMVLGAGMLAVGFAGWGDSYMAGLGAALLATGGVQMARWLRYRRDADYREMVDTQARDERNRFIAARAWAWAGYLFVMIAALTSVVLGVTGRDELAFAASMSVCLLMVLYWVSWMLLSRKY